MKHQSKQKEEEEYYSWGNIFMKILWEFVLKLGQSTIFALTFYMGPYHVVVTAVLFGGLMYAGYPISGGFIDPMMVVGPTVLAGPALLLAWIVG